MFWQPFPKVGMNLRKLQVDCHRIQKEDELVTSFSVWMFFAVEATT